MNVLEVRGLTKRYPAFTLNGVSFTCLLYTSDAADE